MHYFFEHNVVCPICATQERIVKMFGGDPVDPPTPPPEIKISELEQKIWKSPVEVKREPIAAILLMFLIASLTLIRCIADIYNINITILLYGVFMYAGAVAVAVGISVGNQKLWIWFSLIAISSLPVYLCQRYIIDIWSILTVVCNLDLLFLWFGLRIYQNEKKSKTSNPKYWWCPGVLSIAMFYGQHYQIVNMFGIDSFTEDYLIQIIIAPIKVALFFVLGYWMAYPYKKNK